MSRADDPIPGLAAAAGLALLVAYVAWHRWSFLASSPYPFGIDGYFYPVQLRSLLETGRLEYPSAPLALWLMAPLAALGGAVWAVKVVAAIATALIAVPLYGISRELSADRACSLVAAALATTAASSFYFSVEFVKNGVGLTIAAFAFWALLWAYRRRAEPGAGWRLALVGLGVVSAWLAHKTAGGLLLVGGAPIAIRWIRGSQAPARTAAITGLATLSALVIAAVLWPRRLLSMADASLVAELFTTRVDMTLPVLHLEGGSGDRVLHLGRDVPLAAGAAIASWGLWRWRRTLFQSPAPWALAGWSALAIVCALPILDVSHPDRLGFRLRLLAFVLLAIHAGPLLRAALAPVRSATTRAAIALALAGFVVAARPHVDPSPVVEQHPALVAAVRAADGLVPAGDVIITPERRLVFMLTWFTRRGASTRPDAVTPEKRWRLLPLPAMSPAVRAAITEVRRSSASATIHSLHPYDALGMILLSERSWNEVLARLAPDQRARAESWPTY